MTEEWNANDRAFESAVRSASIPLLARGFIEQAPAFDSGPHLISYGLKSQKMSLTIFWERASYELDVSLTPNGRSMKQPFHLGTIRALSEEMNRPFAATSAEALERGLALVVGELLKHPDVLEGSPPAIKRLREIRKSRFAQPDAMPKLP